MRTQSVSAQARDNTRTATVPSVEHTPVSTSGGSQSSGPVRCSVSTGASEHQHPACPKGFGEIARAARHLAARCVAATLVLTSARQSYET